MSVNSVESLVYLLPRFRTMAEPLTAERRTPNAERRTPNGERRTIQGPSDSPARVERILRALETRCGEGGYHYIVAGDNFEPFDSVGDSLTLAH